MFRDGAGLNGRVVGTDGPKCDGDQRAAPLVIEADSACIEVCQHNPVARRERVWFLKIGQEIADGAPAAHGVGETAIGRLIAIHPRRIARVWPIGTMLINRQLL